MRAVVFAAGQGTRMRPLTDNRPKPMLPVAGRPILAHVLDAASDYVDGYVLVVGYGAEMVESYFGREFAGLPIDYVSQERQLGTAHAVACAREHVDERFLALNGDMVFDADLVAGLASAEETAIAVMPVENPSAFGVVDVGDGAVRSIVEKPADPPSNLVNLGLYAFEPAVFEHIDGLERSERGEYEITDALTSLVDDGERVAAVEHTGTWLDVGRPWELLNATEQLLAGIDRRLDGEIEDGATIHGPVVVEDGARVRAGAYVEGPVLVQSGADVGPNAYVRATSVVGPGVRVGNAVEVKNSILMRDTAVGHLSYVGDSVLGEGVNLGAGTKVANLRHDDANVKMRVKGAAEDSGRRKLGVVAGDGVKTGINSSLNAGLKLGSGAMTRPGEAVMRDRGTD